MKNNAMAGLVFYFEMRDEEEKKTFLLENEVRFNDRKYLKEVHSH